MTWRTYHGCVTHVQTPVDHDHDPAGAEELGLREQKKRQTRMAMHRAALELVVEHGLSGVTAQMIAERAGVSTRTFFNHWVTKESAILGVIGDEGKRAITSLRDKLEVMNVRDAMRAMMREAIAKVPVDRGLRELKKQVMEQEPSLHLVSSGNLQAMQTELVEVLEEALDGEDARDRAVVLVQLSFALTRSAFAISMRSGIDPASAFDRVLSLYDEPDIDL